MGNNHYKGAGEEKSTVGGELTALPVAFLGQKCQGSSRYHKVSASSSGNKLLCNGAFQGTQPVGSLLTMDLQACSSC